MSQFILNFFSEKSSQKISAASILFKKLAKENNRLTGENSPNPVTLKANGKHFRFRPNATVRYEDFGQLYP
jgi:hypothetical protein